MLSKPQNLTFIVVAVLTITNTGANGTNNKKTIMSMARMRRTIYICQTQSKKTAIVHLRVTTTGEPANFIKISERDSFLL
jgi:hypothetical protein